MSPDFICRAVPWDGSLLLSSLHPLYSLPVALYCEKRLCPKRGIALNSLLAKDDGEVYLYSAALMLCISEAPGRHNGATWFLWQYTACHLWLLHGFLDLLFFSQSVSVNVCVSLSRSWHFSTSFCYSVLRTIITSPWFLILLLYYDYQIYIYPANLPLLGSPWLSVLLPDKICIIKYHSAVK